METIPVVGPDLAERPFDTIMHASRSTTMMGNTIRDGTVTLKRRLIKAAVPCAEILQYQGSAAEVEMDIETGRGRVPRS